MSPARIGRGLISLTRAVIAQHVSNPQPVLREDPLPARRLHRAMLLDIAPLRNALLVAPERNRQYRAGTGQAFEALDRNEPVDPLEQRSQLLRRIEIGVTHSFARRRLEDHR